MEEQLIEMKSQDTQKSLELNHVLKYHFRQHLDKLIELILVSFPTTGVPKSF